LIGRLAAPGNLPDKPVSPLGHGFNKTRSIGDIPKGFPQPFDGVVQAVIEVDKGVGGPKALPQFFAVHHVARMLQQELQDLQRLLLQLHPDAMLPQFSGDRIYLERTEANGRRRSALNRHELGPRPWEKQV
jgi:hypothetical protein